MLKCACDIGPAEDAGTSPVETGDDDVGVLDEVEYAAEDAALPLDAAGM